MRGYMKRKALETVKKLPPEARDTLIKPSNIMVKKTP